ncbi:myb-like protein U [Thunnus thynnus]|uniref:myb-like protein U n=1 Tax=Thunnus thynnus TaxID=8237 RepID=UPI0035274DF0
MKVCHTLICFFFLTLQDGNIGLINAEIPIFIRTEGQSITVPCHFTYTGSRKYFCKDECEEYILEMYDVRDRIGRYIMEYKNTRAGSRLDVTITQLTKSDSGRYRCGLDIPFLIDLYWEFKIIVIDAPSTSKPNLTPRPSVRSVQSASTPATTQSFRRSSTTSFSAETTNQSEEEQTEISAGGSAPSTSKPNLTLRPSLTSVQSASTPATTQSFRRSSTTSFSAETTNQSEEQQPEISAGRPGTFTFGTLLLKITSQRQRTLLDELQMIFSSSTHVVCKNKTLQSC